MTTTRTLLTSILLATGLVIPTVAQQDKVIYVPRVEYPLFKQMDAHHDSLKAAQDSVTSKIRARQKAETKFKDSTSKELRFDVSKIVRPVSPDEFKAVFYFPPTPQDETGTCWCFCSTSFAECEVYRLTGRKIKLSEMFTVYHEWIEKVRRFVQERGESALGAGSEEIGMLRAMRLYGAMPRDAYDGLNPAYPHFRHNEMDAEIRSYMDYVKNNNLWNEDDVLASLKIILNKYMGQPPDTFTFEEKTYTPMQFVSDVLKFVPDDYVSVMSTLKYPFYARGLFEAEDNWSRDSSYLNLPLDVWYKVIDNALQKGYSVTIGGGTAEPGYMGTENIGVIPDFDIPQNAINQDSREYRIYRGTTGDNHCLHIVGSMHKGGRTWFLVKDSGSGSRKGPQKGYFFFRDDYVRLKMLTFMVHKDMLKGIKGSGGSADGSVLK